MDPKIWGPHMWFSLHSISFNYPVSPSQEIKERFRNFFNSLEYILPCELCRVHYSQHIREHPIEFNLDNRRKLVYWVIDVHNLVNRMLGKPVMGYNQVLEMYSKIFGKKIELDLQEEKCTARRNNDGNDSSIKGENIAIASGVCSSNVSNSSMKNMLKNPMFYIAVFILVLIFFYFLVLNKK